MVTYSHVHSIAAQASQIPTILITDTISVSESISASFSKHLSKAVSDVISSLDSATKGRVVTDSIQFTDTVSKAIQKQVLDILLTSDAANKNKIIPVTDILSTTDTITTISKGFIRQVTDALLATESPQRSIMKTILESPVFAESVKNILGITIADFISIADVILANKTTYLFKTHIVRNVTFTTVI